MTPPLHLKDGQGVGASAADAAPRHSAKPEPDKSSPPSGRVSTDAACVCGKCLECDAAGYHLDQAITSMGERIQARRKAMGLTLEQLAERSGMSKSYIWEIENGKNKNPTIRTALTLARALGWTLSECVGLYEHAPLLHPEAMRIATQVDLLLRPTTAECDPSPNTPDTGRIA